MDDIKVITETPMAPEEFPADIVFKTIIRNLPSAFTLESIKSILAERDVRAAVTMRESQNATFISYTVSARFDSSDTLLSVCAEISTLEGFMTMF